MARENGGPVATYTGRARSILWALLPAVALGLIGAGRRSLVGSLAFALVFAAVAGSRLAQFPALQAGLPTASQIAAGLILVLAAGAAGGIIGRGVGSSLAASSPAPRQA
ncbi:MAG: hypothetical protein HYY64_12325 [Candidatus Rokubacteria bacterium]|nr:hypothetical protein [Candidatus Rokubacteria bacterium]